MLDDIKGVVQNHLSSEKNKVKETINILNSLPIVIELKQQIEQLKKENKDLKEKLLNSQEKVNIELEIVEVDAISDDDTNYKKNNSLETIIPAYFTGVTDSIPSEEDPSIDGDDDDESDEDADNNNNAEDADDESSEDIFAECTSKDSLTKSVEFGYTLVSDEAISVLVLPETLIEIEGAAPAEALEVFKISVDGTHYYILDKFNSRVYTINMDSRMGPEVGHLENGNVFFS